MMKNIFLISCLIFTTFAIGQANSLELEKEKMKQALAFGDKTVATNAMYNIIAAEGAMSTYKDSLAYLYFNSRNYVSCFLVTNDIISRKPENLELLEMNAISLESMGALEKASEAYANLLAKTSNNYHGYKLAGLQFGAKKFDEALVTIKKADQLPDDGAIKVNFQVNKNYNQNVDLKAAIAYLEGMISLGLKKDKEAITAFERAVKVFPDFVLAKSKITTLAVPEEEK